MPFKEGHKLAKGRPKGAVNKRTAEFRAVLEANDFCPASALMDVYKTALTKFAEDLEQVESGRMSPMESKAANYLRIAADMAKDLASYTYPKLKAIEQTKHDPTKDMTPAERLAAMKQAVAYMETQVKGEP